MPKERETISDNVGFLAWLLKEPNEVGNRSYSKIIFLAIKVKHFDALQLVYFHSVCSWLHKDMFLVPPCTIK